jgi:SET family sugar efflux transporter-like MFS transporter
MNGWSEALRQELQPDIRVTLIEPGAVATELTDHITDPAAKQGAEQFYAQLAITADDVADVIAFAIVSVAWIAGPPLATLIIGWFGNRAILLAIAAVAVLNIATTAIMIAQRRAERAAAADGPTPAAPTIGGDESPVGRLGVVLIMAAFILLQATNATAMTIMTVHLTQTLQLDVIWAGVALGVAAALEVPGLMFIGRLVGRFSHLGLIATGCLAGIAYYLGVAFVTGPVLLIALQLLSAWSFAGISGVGLPLFQQMIPRPGLSTGLFMKPDVWAPSSPGRSSRSAHSPPSGNVGSSSHAQPRPWSA